MAYNGRRQGPGQLWAARAGRGREKERLGPGQAGPPGRALKKNGWARARAAEKERHHYLIFGPGLAHGLPGPCKPLALTLLHSQLVHL